MWAKPSKLLLLAQIGSRLGNTCWKAHWLAFCQEIRHCQALWDTFCWTKCLKSLEDSHILPYWIWNPYEPIALDLIESITAGSQSHYVLLDIEPPAPLWYHNLFKYEYIILTANCIITYWIQQHCQPILLPLIGMWIKNHSFGIEWYHMVLDGDHTKWMVAYYTSSYWI